MGKSLPFSPSCQFPELTKPVPSLASSHKPKLHGPRKPLSPSTVSFGESRVDPARDPSHINKMEEEGGSGLSLDPECPNRVPLARVVSDCVKRWFQDTLKEAKAGDVAMQVLVGQMYTSGYGVPKDPQKGRAWISRASNSRSSALIVSDKHPGYNASDSDSDEAR